MPPPLPDRFRLEVRLGRDHDIEQWLATDVSLDRPVEIRVLGPDADAERRAGFLRSVQGAATVSHPHFTWVYTAGEVPGGVYAVSEWTGAISVADRLEAGETIPVEDFLPNAAGLADALAALHAEGIVHGAIDTSSLFHAVAHSAKLGGVGRVPVGHTARDDVRALAAALEEGLTGRPAGGPPPSEVIDGLSPVVDAVFERARLGALTARQFADALSAAPTPSTPPPESPRFARRLLLAAVTLVIAATSLVFVGRLLLADAGTPILMPETQTRGQTPVLPSTTIVVIVATPTTTPAQPVDVTAVRSVDPFGEGEENDERLTNLIDGELSTTWRTERYNDPLPALKPGVGVSFEVSSDPAWVEIIGLAEAVEYQLGWSENQPDTPDGWETVVRGRTEGGTLVLQLPTRSSGWWSLWFTDLPEVADGGHLAELSEVRFSR
jgi:eukaryotic-like serine/threonine-protein kinase